MAGWDLVRNLDGRVNSISLSSNIKIHASTV